ncbi:hypothetical protein YTPLAS18_18400 [Nitrospira sp.]|nr:hypothetical protein YTPLAS18_18400 [Nitrospira sp.]
MRQFRSATLNATLFLGSIAASVAATEVGLRVYGYTPPPTIQRPYYAPQFYYKPDPVNGYDIVDNFSGGVFEFPEYIRAYGTAFTVSSNKLGCRDRSFEHNDDYVLLLGDSFTWGMFRLNTRGGRRSNNSSASEY